MMQLYRCDSCTAEYVVEDGQAIRCPHCDSKERTSKGEFTVEDVNLILEERKNLMEDLDKRTQPLLEEPELDPKHSVLADPWDDNPFAEDDEDKWEDTLAELQRREDEMSETDERDHGDQ
jgi:uncharacterized Zn finger protein (UPF0148 family)